MIKRFIVWYLKRHKARFECKGYTVRLFDTGYHTMLMHYADIMSGVNCRCSFVVDPCIDFKK